MAALIRGNSSLESTPKPNISKRRQHPRPEIRSRRSFQNERQSRCSPSRQQQWQTMPFSTSSLNSSAARSVSAPHEHTHIHGPGITMERTPSGSSIMSDTLISYETQYDNTLTDEEAARRVENHCRRLPSNHKHERILRKLIRRDDPLDDGEVDDAALHSILTTADSLFFGGELAGRVRWEWSSHNRYQTETIGSTALRRCTHRPGIETLIVLSHPILRSPLYDRRLLLSAFLHELVHCYLFIVCGFDARFQGGHTEGFERIVTLIDNWVGKGYLRLCNFKANLDHFVKDRYKAPIPVAHYWGIEMCREEWRDEHGYQECNQSSRPRERLLDTHAKSRHENYWV